MEQHPVEIEAGETSLMEHEGSLSEGSTPQEQLLEAERSLRELIIDPVQHGREIGLSQEAAQEVDRGYQTAMSPLREQSGRILRSLRAGVLAVTLLHAPQSAGTSSTAPGLEERSQEHVSVVMPNATPEVLPDSVEDEEVGDESEEVEADDQTSDEGQFIEGVELSKEELKLAERRNELHQEFIRSKERVAEGFPDRASLLSFAADLSKESSVEYSLVYGEDEQGKLVVLKFDQGNDGAVFFSKEDLSANFPRSQGVNHVRVLHTHPQKAIADLLQESSLPVHSGPLSLPFSVPDLNLSIYHAWRNRYDDITKWQDATPGTYTAQQEIVDPSGVWSIEIDPTNSYVQEIMHARESRVVHGETGKALLEAHPSLTEESLAEIVRTLASPDELVWARAFATARSHGLSLEELLQISVAHQVSSVSSDGEEYDLSKLQLEVASSTPEERPQQLQKFIDFFAHKGIPVTYTPHDPLSPSHSQHPLEKDQHSSEHSRGSE